MSDVPTRARDLACRVLAREAGALAQSTSGESRGLAAEAAGRAFDRLRAHMGGLVGIDGYHALLTRARTSALEEVPWLATVRVGPDATLDGFKEATLLLDGPEIVRGSAALMGHVVALLIKLIGDGLTVDLLSEVWPGFAISAKDTDVRERSE